MHSPSQRNKRRKTNTIERYSVVAVDTEVLLYDILDDVEGLPFMIRPKIYGVVQHILPSGGDGNNDYSVQWATKGLLNMNDDEASEYNEILFKANDLTVIKRPNDEYENGDMYLHLLFDRRTETEGWCIHKFSPYECDSCNEIPNASRPCRRGAPWIQGPMLQLFIDLYMWNEGLSNREKRFHCYRWYTMIVHGVLTVGDRRRVCPCIEGQIRGLFPAEEGEEYVGFVPIRSII